MGLSPNEVNHHALERRFTDLWEDYSRRAERNKRGYKVHRFLSRPVLHLSWLMLLLSLWGMFAPETSLTRAVPYLVPGFSLLMLAAATWQMFRGYRESWITYRTATEHLRQAYYRYRLGLPPFEGDDSAREFDRELSRVNKFVHETNESLPGPVVSLYRLLHMQRPGGVGGQALPMVIQPRFAGGDFDRPEGEQFLFAYIADQVGWHYDKARTYLWRFFLLQLAVAAISAVGLWLSWAFEPQIRMLGLIGTLNLLTIYISDFFDLTALCQRYYYVVTELRRLGHEFQVAEGPFAGLTDHQQRLRLAAEVDHVLAREFDYWHARAGKSPKDRPASAMDLPTPEGVERTTVA